MNLELGGALAKGDLEACGNALVAFWEEEKSGERTISHRRQETL